MKLIPHYILLVSALFLATFDMAAQTAFSAVEQQQISVKTPGLFDKSDKFEIDFKALRFDGLLLSFACRKGKTDGQPGP